MKTKRPLMVLGSENNNSNLTSRTSIIIIVNHSSVPGLHSCLGYSLRLLARYERDKVLTNVDIHTLMRVVNNEARHSRHSHFLWLGTDLPNMSPRASRWNENRPRMWRMRRMYPSHSRFRLVSCCLDEIVNQELKFIPSDSRFGSWLILPFKNFNQYWKTEHLFASGAASFLIPQNTFYSAPLGW